MTSNISPWRKFKKCITFWPKKPLLKIIIFDLFSFSQTLENIAISWILKKKNNYFDSEVYLQHFKGLKILKISWSLSCWSTENLFSKRYSSLHSQEFKVGTFLLKYIEASKNEKLSVELTKCQTWGLDFESLLCTFLKFWLRLRRWNYCSNFYWWKLESIRSIHVTLKSFFNITIYFLQTKRLVPCSAWTKLEAAECVVALSSTIYLCRDLHESPSRSCGLRYW